MVTTTNSPASPASRRFRTSPRPRFRLLLTMTLLLLLVPCVGAAQAADTPIGPAPSAVEGLVTGVAGSIVSLFGGSVQIDVSGARIVSANADAAGTPAPPITVGCRIGAQVLVPDVQPAIFPPPLKATLVIVTAPQAGSLTGILQGVDAAPGSFSMLYLTIQTNASTRFSGETDKGPITSLSDLTPGLFAVVQVASTSGGLLALKVDAHGIRTPPPPPTIVTFRGVVKTIDTNSWTIGDKTVVVNSDTKISGGPKVGDTVEVVAKSDAAGILTALSIIDITTPPPPVLVSFRGTVKSIGTTRWTINDRTVLVNGDTKILGGPAVGDTVDVVAKTDATAANPASVTLTALSIVKVGAPPPPPPTTEFDGVVQAIPPLSASTVTFPMGHWKIGDRDVLVTGLTRISGSPKVGDTVHVKGYFMPGAATVVPAQFVATSIEKKN
jgi:hypothetical protein